MSVAGTSLPIGDGLLASGTIIPAKIEASQGENSVSSIVGTSIPELSVLQGLLGIKGVNIAGVDIERLDDRSNGDTGIIGIESASTS